jgi:hypothetical protein
MISREPEDVSQFTREGRPSGGAQVKTSITPDGGIITMLESRRCGALLSCRSFLRSRRAFLGLSAGVAAALAALPAAASAASKDAEPLLRFGVIADCQYADKPDGPVRLYRRSIEKLQEAVAPLNDADLRFAIHLGDFWTSSRRVSTQ